jgi:enolase
MEDQINLFYIQEVACGDQKMVEELVSDIIELIEETKMVLSDLLQSEDFAGIAKAAHKLKAPILMVGAIFFYEKVEELERTAKSAPMLAEIMPIYNSFETLSQGFKQRLESIINENKKGCQQ